jgi:hypothetical protein
MKYVTAHTVLLLMVLQPFFSSSTAFLVSLSLYKVGKTPWRGDQPFARPLPTHRTKQTQYGFELTTPVFERAKTIHALDRSANVIGSHTI